MKNYSTAYRLIKGEEVLEFNSEKEACEYLGVAKCSVASCYRRNRMCKGYTIERVGITTHNATNTRLYKIWCSMHERCGRPKHPQYKNYGGRGIVVCDIWSGEDGFYRFKEWAGESGYTDELTIDRIAPNGNYEPSNCRWATFKEQANNKRTNHIVQYKGEEYTLSELAEKVGINKTTLKERLKLGWSVDKAAETPVRLRTKGYRMSSGAKMDEVSE